MQIVHDQWLNVLKQQQVEEIAPAPGTPFDPNQHEAMMQQDSHVQSADRRAAAAKRLRPARPHAAPGTSGRQSTPAKGAGRTYRKHHADLRIQMLELRA